MAKHLTSKGREVNHLHRLVKDPEIHVADLELLRRLMAEQFPHAEIVGESTIRYNCHGFALAPSHEGWFNFPDFFLSDDYMGVSMDSPQLGDVLIYGRNGAIAHSAVVIEVSGSTIVRLQSKWGRVNEVKHSVCHVPEVYGEPIVLLRPRPVLDLHPAVNKSAGVSATAKSANATLAAPAAEAVATGSAETETSRNIPQRLMLMFASTPEVERQIRQSNQSTQGRSAPRDTPSPLGNSGAESAATLATFSASEPPSGDDAQDEIQNALAEFRTPLTQFQLMLASTPQVLREAASSLRPVKELIELDKTNPGTRTAIVKFFEKPETQADEEIAGITLFLLTKIPTKDAVVPIARYLSTGTVTTFNGGLAADALKEAFALQTP